MNEECNKTEWKKKQQNWIIIHIQYPWQSIVSVNVVKSIIRYFQAAWNENWNELRPTKSNFQIFGLVIIPCLPYGFKSNLKVDVWLLALRFSKEKYINKYRKLCLSLCVFDRSIVFFFASRKVLREKFHVHDAIFLLRKSFFFCFVVGGRWRSWRRWWW